MTTSSQSLAREQGRRQENANYLFKCLILANFIQYLEAGAVPALLLDLSDSFNMGSGSQGLLGGVVYMSLSLGSPVAGYLLRKYDHKTVISTAVALNMLFTFLWAMTPVGRPYSTRLFIALRFVMGLCQCVLCVFLPLWTHENAPKDKNTSWMSYLQASVPFGVMTGYIIASTLMTISRRKELCMGLICWRWPFLVEIMLLCPLYVIIYMVPREDI
ncbi:major facilitator superfamily domain-containing protein, partial [Ochromonadaceae sp. CCMP2298]